MTVFPLDCFTELTSPETNCLKIFLFFSLLSLQMSFWDHRDHPDVIPSASSALLFLSYSFYPSFIPLVRLEGVLSGNLLD